MERVIAVRLRRLVPAWTPLMFAGLALLGSGGLVAGELLYRRDGVVFYPAIAVVNYALRGLPMQAVGMFIVSLSMLAIWNARRRGRRWTIVGLFGVGLALVSLIVAASPYRPTAHTSDGSAVYQLASYHPRPEDPEIFLLFACDTWGLVCHQVSAFAPFDVISGQHVAGTPSLLVIPTSHAVIVSVGGRAIGTYRPSVIAK